SLVFMLLLLHTRTATENYPLSLHDALPICEGMETALLLMQLRETMYLALGAVTGVVGAAGVAWLWSRYGHKVNLALFFQVTAILDRKSTRLNSSHLGISYAVFCLIKNR